MGVEGQSVPKWERPNAERMSGAPQHGVDSAENGVFRLNGSLKRSVLRARNRRAGADAEDRARSAKSVLAYASLPEEGSPDNKAATAERGRVAGLA